MLLDATADNPRIVRGAEGRRAADLSAVRRPTAPKAASKRKTTGPVTMEEVVERLPEAFEKVAANRGAPGPDRQTIRQVRKHLSEVLSALRAALLDGRYRPGEIRRVWIPKAGGGQRGLGIPNVVDRMVQEAVRAVLEPLYEPTFHPSSHGFRPSRSCQTAISEARGYVDEGYRWVVDLDLEKFFDQVHHQRLLSRLAQRVLDKRLLVLIGRMLKAQVVLPDGVKVSTEEGVPQGGPLSPLLSNIVLSELDEELARRGHRFVRYADDCNIYVRSERAGQRTMASVTTFIHRRLRLKVNADKSAVARPETRHFLGYRLQPRPGAPAEVLLSERSEKRLRERIVELTPRSRGWSLRETIRGINAYFDGWFGHFRVCTGGIERVLQGSDAHIRRRMRAIVLKHWKTKRTTARRLIRLDVRPKTAWRSVYRGRQSLWALSHNPAVDRGLRNAFFAER
ncbi:MAG: group II intron reverse transcriptase/maturase, partial [Nanoarchaeota archaeon]|nr:group II intron reverse transcriptase/maturase [Nanoarchaeota archaeon]